MDEYLEYFRTTPKEEWEREALHAEFPNAPLSAFWVTLEEIEASKHLDFDSSAALHAGNLLNTEAYTTYFNHHPFERWSYTHFNANTNRSYEVWMWALFQRSSQQNPPLSHDETDQLLFLRNQKQRVLEPSSTSKPKSINTNPPSSSIQPSDTDIDANTPIDSTDTESGAAKGLKRGVTSKPQWFQGKRKKSANSSHNEVCLGHHSDWPNPSHSSLFSHPSFLALSFAVFPPNLRNLLTNRTKRPELPYFYPTFPDSEFQPLPMEMMSSIVRVPTVRLYCCT